MGARVPPPAPTEGGDGKCVYRVDLLPFLSLTLTPLCSCGDFRPVSSASVCVCVCVCVGGTVRQWVEGGCVFLCPHPPLLCKTITSPFSTPDLPCPWVPMSG